MKVYIYESNNPKKYAANFFADAFFKHTGQTFPKEKYQTLPRAKNGKPKPIRITHSQKESNQKQLDLLHFNISHSGKYWGIAFSDRPVGLDFQTKEKQGKPRKFSTKALQKILSPNEILIDNNPLHNFVVKEAYTKLTGEGLSSGFSTLDANQLIRHYHPYSLEDDNLILYVFSRP